MQFQFRYSHAYARVRLTLTDSERETIDLMLSYIAYAPFDGRHWNTDLMGRDWYAHMGVGFILVYRVEGNTIRISQIVRWDGPQYVDPQTGRDGS